MIFGVLLHGDGQCTVLLALDISAAFAAVDHTTLVERAKTVSALTVLLLIG